MLRVNRRILLHRAWSILSVVAAVAVTAGCARRVVAGRVQENDSRGSSAVAVVVLASPFKLDPAWLVERWEDAWGIGEALRVMHAWTDPTRTRRRYRISDGRHTLVVELSSERLAGPRLDRMLASAGRVADSERAALRRHRGHLELSFGSQTRPSVRAARFAARALLLLLARPATLGHAPGSSLVYHPAESSTAVPALSTGDLQDLFVDLIESPVPGGRVVHTVGLEVLGFPDLRVRLASGRGEKTCRTLLRRAVETLLAGGNPPAGGTRLELPGPVVLEARRVDRPRHPAGRFGVLELVPR